MLMTSEILHLDKCLSVTACFFFIVDNLNSVCHVLYILCCIY